jgi:hypothetical protein
MSRTFLVWYRGGGFWAFDVAASVFAKYLIDACAPRAVGPGYEWLARPVSEWRVHAAVTD